MSQTTLSSHGMAMPPRLRIALDALRQGRAVILQDDDDRENEGDLIVAADRITVPMMATLIRECSGIVCLCLTGAHLERLALPPMVARNGSRYGTAFTVSIEAREGVGTGVSAADRVATIRAAIAPGAVAGDLVSPGHVFPLCAAPAACSNGAAIPRARSSSRSLPGCSRRPCCAS